MQNDAELPAFSFNQLRCAPDPSAANPGSPRRR